MKESVVEKKGKCGKEWVFLSVKKRYYKRQTKRKMANRKRKHETKKKFFRRFETSIVLSKEKLSEFFEGIDIRLDRRIVKYE